MRQLFGHLRTWVAGGAVALAGAVAAWAASPGLDEWRADPDEQFMLDVNIRQLRLGDGVRAYATPEGTCVVFGDMLTTLDLPVTVDLKKKTAIGWAFKESNRLQVDLASETAQFGGKSEKISASAVRETPDGWCVDTETMGRWLGIGIRPMTAGSLIVLESESKLPVEMAREREQRAARIKPAAMPFDKLPRVKMPYRMWRAPSLDFIVSAGVTYRASSGVRVDRQASVLAAGEIAKMSYDATLSTDGKGRPQSLRVRAFRSDPDGELLGPLQATHFAVGDVEGLASRLLAGSNGRGVEVTNRPLFNPIAFDRTRFEGELPPGWDAELYRNGELLSFARSDGSGRYKFDQVQLVYGDNRFEILLYGPQGQVRTRVETLNVGQAQVPAGKTWYWAGVSQPGKELAGKIIGQDERGSSRLPGSGPDFSRPDLQATVQVEHGLDKRTSIGVLAATLLADGEKLTFVEGSVRRSIGPALVEAAVARDNRGGMAARAQAIAKIGAINVNVDALLANDFVVSGKREARYRDIRVGLSAPFKLGRQQVMAQGDMRLIERGPNDRMLNSTGRISTNINGFNLTTVASWQKKLGSNVPPQKDQFDLSLIGTGRIKDVRLRGEAMWEISPYNRFRRAELSAYWSAGEKADWEGAIGYDAVGKRGLARVSHIRRFNSVAAAASIEAGSDGSFAAGFNLNFSLDSGAGGIRLTSQKLASTGSVEARVYRDLNDNGRRDADEPFEEGAMITTGLSASEQVTDKQGLVRIGGLAPFQPVAIGIDGSSLSDPSLTPRKALQVVVPRPGLATKVDIALVGAGDVEAVLVRQDGRGIEGLDVEMVDERGEVVATARTDYDGFILFERVGYGRYTLRVAASSADAAGVDRTLSASVELTPAKSVIRLGTLRVASRQTIASLSQLSAEAPSAR